MNTRFNPAQDPQRFEMGGNPDPEDDPYEHQEPPADFGFVDEDDLVDELIALGLFEDVEAVWFEQDAETGTTSLALLLAALAAAALSAIVALHA